MLASRYPLMTDQARYDKARMITAAVIVKIHTVEWTPAIIPNPTLEVGMNASWYGLNKYLKPKLVTLPSYDRFYTESCNAETYTQVGLDWIDAQTGLADQPNAFYPWE